MKTATPPQAIKQTVEALLEEYCVANDIYDYTVVYDKMLRRVAGCEKTYSHFDFGMYVASESTFKFYFSVKFLEHLSYEQIKDTVIHEVAHALTDPRQSAHGARWKATARRMGGSGNTKHHGSESESEAMAKYRGTCPNGHKIYKMRLTKKAHEVSCSTCKSVWDPAYRFTYTQLR